MCGISVLGRGHTAHAPREPTAAAAKRGARARARGIEDGGGRCQPEGVARGAARARALPEALRKARTHTPPHPLKGRGFRARSRSRGTQLANGNPGEAGSPRPSPSRNNGGGGGEGRTSCGAVGRSRRAGRGAVADETADWTARGAWPASAPRLGLAIGGFGRRGGAKERVLLAL